MPSLKEKGAFHIADVCLLEVSRLGAGGLRWGGCSNLRQ